MRAGIKAAQANGVVVVFRSLFDATELVRAAVMEFGTEFPK
jgi:hypothetical protein